jgi:hypothetical protein
VGVTDFVKKIMATKWVEPVSSFDDDTENNEEQQNCLYITIKPSKKKILS